ncbi:MAG: ABC transporter ATP-binding protein [Pseudomonadota bacterium]|nr:ABC transporter ATP-binding protein [Pseudomonadota bacterium]
MLELTDISSGYGSVHVLSDISLKVEAGQTVCIIGSNGAGKTTLLRTIAGLIRPKAGTLTYKGQDLSRSSTSARLGMGIALVPEGRRVFSPLTVYENLQMGAFRRIWPARKDGVDKDIEMVFDLFPRLAERKQQPAGLLSGGEQQMLAIGRALMSRPELLLLDEPSMGLAPRVVQEIFATIRNLSAEGISILLAEQNANMALKSADYAHVLAEGEFARSAEASVLAQDPSVRTAYLGL